MAQSLVVTPSRWVLLGEVEQAAFLAATAHAGGLFLVGRRRYQLTEPKLVKRAWACRTEPSEASA